jgi:hypothetical protein
MVQTIAGNTLSAARSEAGFERVASGRRRIFLPIHLNADSSFNAATEMEMKRSRVRPSRIRESYASSYSNKRPASHMKRRTTVATPPTPAKTSGTELTSILGMYAWKHEQTRVKMR